MSLSLYYIFYIDISKRTTIYFSPIKRLIVGRTPLIGVRLIAIAIELMLRRRRWWRRRRCGLLVIGVITRVSVVAGLGTVVRVIVSSTCRSRCYTIVVITSTVAGQTRRRILNRYRHKIRTTMQDRHMLRTTRAGQRDGADFLWFLFWRKTQVSVINVCLQIPLW